MRYIRHPVWHNIQEGVSALVDECGVTGYGAYWIICEKVAAMASNLEKPSAKLNLTNLARSCRTSSKKLLKILLSLHKNKLINLTIEDNKCLSIEIIGLVIRDNPLRLPASQWIPLRKSIFERDNFTCQYCGEYGKNLECDHIIPVTRGGTNDYENLATACFKCNRSKRDKLVSEWLQ